MIAFLPLVSAKSVRSGRHARKRRAVSTEPVRMTASTRGSVTSPRPTSSSGHGRKASASLRDAGVPQGLGEMPADQHGLGRGLEDDAVAGGQRGEHAARGDRQREVPRRRHDHDAERLHPALAQTSTCVERARVVAREVDRLRDLGVGLGHGLGAVDDHRADQVAAPPSEHRRRAVEQGAALRARPARPGRLRRARGVERAAHGARSASAWR